MTHDHCLIFFKLIECANACLSCWHKIIFETCRDWAWFTYQSFSFLTDVREQQHHLKHRTDNRSFWSCHSHHIELSSDHETMTTDCHHHWSESSCQQLHKNSYWEDSKHHQSCASDRTQYRNWKSSLHSFSKHADWNHTWVHHSFSANISRVT